MNKMKMQFKNHKGLFAVVNIDTERSIRAIM